MRPQDAAELLLLAALWGASFLFMRIGAPEFGPAALVFVRVAGASALLLVLLAGRGQLAELRRHWRALAVVGVANSALPFVLYGYAALQLTGVLTGIGAVTLIVRHLTGMDDDDGPGLPPPPRPPAPPRL